MSDVAEDRKFTQKKTVCSNCFKQSLLKLQLVSEILSSGFYRTKRISLTREFFLFPSPCQERQKKISDWLEAQVVSLNPSDGEGTVVNNQLTMEKKGSQLDMRTGHFPKTSLFGKPQSFWQLQGADKVPL